MLLQTLMESKPTAAVILSLAIILLVGFLVTRVTKKCKLPNVTGYIFAGILIGPYVLKLIPDVLIGSMDFVTDIALAFIAFGVGKYFRLSNLRKNGPGVIVITLCEALIAAVLITVAMLTIFRLPLSFALILGAIGCATAPASTIMTIRQYKAKGRFVDTILQVVALDDAVALLAFSVCAAVAQGLSSNGRMDVWVVALPLLVNVAAVGIGILMGFLLNKLISERRSQEHRLVLVIGLILLLTGACTFFDVSPLLSCMALGTAYINFGGTKNLFKQVNRFTPPILLLFFVLSGMRLNIPSLLTAGIIGVVYFFVRIAGKYAGAYLGARLTAAPLEIRRYLGLALIPQAGVSIGLAALGQRILPTEMGAMLSTIILSSAVLYEMIGPACAKASLFLSHTVPPKDRSAKPAPILPAKKDGKAGKEPSKAVPSAAGKKGNKTLQACTPAGSKER